MDIISASINDTVNNTVIIMQYINPFKKQGEPLTPLWGYKKMKKANE